MYHAGRRRHGELQSMMQNAEKQNLRQPRYFAIMKRLQGTRTAPTRPPFIGGP
jgi:hypothetical protein